MNKTLPIFKILAIMCLAIVSIIEISILTDNTEGYTQLAQMLDAEYMSILFYALGFSFAGLTASTLFSLNKRKANVIGTAFGFIVIIAVGYYLNEYFEPDFDMDEVSYLFCIAVAIYAEEYIACFLLSGAALVLGILDTAVGNSASFSTSSNTCIYCGKNLYPGEKCTCDLTDSYLVTDFETEPENYADDVEKRQCTFCGRMLYGTEVCVCPTAQKIEQEKAMRRMHSVTDSDRYASKADTATPTPRRGFINKEFKVNPDISSAATPPPAKKPSDSSFFNKPSDL